MKATDLTTAELEAYLDESLPIARMAAVEEALRREPQLLRTLEAINGRRDAGVHSLGEIWRRNRRKLPNAATARQPSSWASSATSKSATSAFISTRSAAATARPISRSSIAASPAGDRRATKEILQIERGFLKPQR